MQKSTRNAPGTQQAQQRPPGGGDRLGVWNMYARLCLKQISNTGYCAAETCVLHP